MITKLALWWLRKVGYWNKINTLEGFKENASSNAEVKHLQYVAYEKGRHRLLHQLSTNTLIK